MNWMDSANCKGKTFLFFGPERERPPARYQREKLAKALCAECSVKADCKQAAPGEYGIWAGSDDNEFIVLTSASR